jgi:hypothetical protein
MGRFIGAIVQAILSWKNGSKLFRLHLQWLHDMREERHASPFAAFSRYRKVT